jgi:hypothetical protein
MTRLPFTVVIRIDTLERAHEAGYVINAFCGPLCTTSLTFFQL